MAIISGGILVCRPSSENRALCGGGNFLLHKVGARVSVRVCSFSNNNDGSAHLDNGNCGGKRRRRKEDVILPSEIDKRSTMRWWLPLLGLSHADREPWTDCGIKEPKTRVMEKISSDEKEMGEAPAKRSKFERGRLTPEKAKLLRKNLRDTTMFHDIMYHSAIASRLASSDNKGKELEKLRP